MSRRRYKLVNAAAAGAGAETNDLSSVVTWANVPDANITESSVTQHQAALSIAATQIASLTATVAELNLLDLSGLTAGWVLSADTATTASWKAAATGGDATLADNEAVTGHWTFTNVSGIDIYDSGGTDFANFNHDGTDFNIDATNTTNLNISNGFTSVDCDANMFVRNGHSMRVYDAANEDFMYFGHDGNNGYIDTAGTGAPGHIELRAETRVGGDGTHGTFIVGDADFSDYLSIKGDGTDINFTITGGGSLDFADHILRQMVLEDVGYSSASEVVSANAVTLTYTEGPGFEIDLEAATGAVTVTISGGPVSGDHGVMAVKVQQDTTADRTITWAGGTFKWVDGTAHVMSTGADTISIYSFETWDGGTTWYGSGADYS